MEKIYGLLTVSAILCAAGCLYSQSGGGFGSITNVSEGVREYKSELHDGYSFRFKAPLAFDENASSDNALITSLIFGEPSNNSVIVVGIMPSFIVRKDWLKEACNKDALSRQLKSQRNLNVTEVKSVTDRNFKNLKSCIAESTVADQDIELPFIVSLAECNGTLPIYVISGGPDAMNEMEFLLDSFECNLRR